MRTGAVILVGLLVATGCSDEPTSGPPGVTPVFPYHQEEPAWSRQGLIAYVDNGIVRVYEDGGAEVDFTLAGIWLMDPPTGERHRILDYGHSPSWSPDGSRLSFVHGGQIFTMAADGSDVQQLTIHGRNFFPSWSPDGQWIAYDSDYLDQGGAKAVWLMRANGSAKTDISTHGTGEWRMPSWSVDGTRILHVRAIAESPSWELFTMAMTGDDAVRLTNSPAMDLYPQYSPDGSRIAFASSPASGGISQLWVMDSDGSNSTQLTKRAHGASWPSWSPDGQSIVYASVGYTEDSPENGVLWIVNAETGEERQLTQHWSEIEN